MEVYFDKRNLLSFIQDAGNNLFGDCTRMLERNFDININCSKAELDLLPDDSEEEKQLKIALRLWMRNMPNGKPWQWNRNFPPERPLKTTVSNGFNKSQLSAVYLLDDDKINTLCAAGGILFAGVGKEVETLSKLFFEDYQYTQTIPIKKMTNWDEFEKYLAPSTDVIWVDQYIFSSPDVYGSNVYAIIKKFAKLSPRKKLNIVFITVKENYNRINKQTFIPNWGEIRDKIKKVVKEATNEKTPPNVTFVLCSKDGFEEHDRIIFTNYRYIYSGDTMNFFDSASNMISSGRNLTVESLAQRKTMENAMTFVEDIQKFIYKIIDKKNEELIQGDEESNYLKFNSDMN